MLSPKDIKLDGSNSNHVQYMILINAHFVYIDVPITICLTIAAFCIIFILDRIHIFNALATSLRINGEKVQNTQIISCYSGDHTEFLLLWRK